jgi:hypothetical protein
VSAFCAMDLVQKFQRNFFLGPRAPSPASSNGFTQGTSKSDNPDDVAFNESGRGRPRSHERGGVLFASRVWLRFVCTPHLRRLFCAS